MRHSLNFLQNLKGNLYTGNKCLKKSIYEFRASFRKITTQITDMLQISLYAENFTFITHNRFQSPTRIKLEFMNFRQIAIRCFKYKWNLGNLYIYPCKFITLQLIM